MMKQPPSYSFPQQISIPLPAIMIPTNMNTKNNNCKCCCPKSPLQFEFCYSVFQNHSYRTNRRFGRPPHCQICNQKKNKHMNKKANGDK